MAGVVRMSEQTTGPVTVTATVTTEDPRVAALVLRDAARHLEQHGFLSTALTHRPGTPGTWRRVGGLDCRPTAHLAGGGR